MSEMYAQHNGTMDDMQRVIKTAVDWQATHIVLVGAAGIAPLAQALHERWEEYQIPMSVAPLENETILQEELIQPPFLGLTTLPEPVVALLEQNHEVVIYNSVIRDLRAVPKSDVV